MENKISKIILSFMVSFTILGATIQNVFATNKTYQITYSAGLIGTFNESLISSYQKIYGKEAVKTSTVTGNITITVEAEKAMPNAPTAQDVKFKEKDYENQYYVLTSGWQPASTKVTENATFVVQYGALVNGVDYSIRYVDATTNQDVATPVFAKASLNETMSAYAKVINGYTFDTQTKTITLTNNENIITFYYTSEEKSEVVDQVEDVVIPRDRVVTTIVGNAPTTTIPDNDTPLTNGDNTTDDDTTIEDNEIPLAKADDLTKNNQTLYFGIGITVAVLVIIVGVVTVIKKRKGQEEN